MNEEERARDEFCDAAYGMASTGVSLEDARILLEAQYQIEKEDPAVSEEEEV